MKTAGYVRRTFRNGNKEYTCTVIHNLGKRQLKRTFERADEAVKYGVKVVKRWNLWENNKDVS